MNLKILKKELKRKKLMNVNLLIFVMLAAAFSSSSLNNMIVAMKGTDYYFKEAQMDDFFILTMRESNDSDINCDAKVYDWYSI